MEAHQLCKTNCYIFTRYLIFFDAALDKFKVADVFKRQLGRHLLVHVVKDDNLDSDHFSADNRVRKIELDEKRSEDLQLRSSTENKGENKTKQNKQLHYCQYECTAFVYLDD